MGVVLAVLWRLFIAVGFFTSGAAGLCLEVVLRTDLVVALCLTALARLAAPVCD